MANVVTDQPEPIKKGVESLLTKYPADAPYYEIHLNPDKSPRAEDLESASHQTVMVELRPAA